MHKYIKKTTKQQGKILKKSTISQKLSQLKVSQIRKFNETGQKLPEKNIKEILINRTLPERQQIIYELLMNGQFKEIQGFIKQKTINKQQVIDSSKQLKELYETLLNQNSQQKMLDKNKKENQTAYLNNEIRTKQMGMKQLFLRSLKRKFDSFKKMNPTHIGLVLTIIFALILLRKFKQRIVPLLRSMINV